MIYLDTSWLVKLYVEEPGAPAVRSVVDREDVVVVSDLSFVEFHSAAARRRRERRLTGPAAAAIVRRFRKEWPDRGRGAVSAEVLARAADLVAAHPLRSLDALHLASALLVATGSPEPLRFGASDARLLAAATAEGLPVAAGE